MQEENRDAKATARGSRRERIMATALEVFDELGYETATVSDILRAAGITSSAFYNYFSDKESVLRALVAAAVEPLAGALREERRRAPGLEDLIGDLCRTTLERVAADPVLCRLLRGNPLKMRALLGDAAMRRVLAELAAELERGMSGGRRPPVDGRYLAAAAVGVTFEVALSMLERDDCDVARTAAFVTAILVGGVRLAVEVPGQAACDVERLQAVGAA